MTIVVIVIREFSHLTLYVWAIHIELLVISFDEFASIFSEWIGLLYLFSMVKVL